MLDILCAAMMFLCCNLNNQKTDNDIDKNEATRITLFSKQAKQFCAQHKYNTRFFFLADMRVHSGKKRFFAVDMNADTILNSGLVAHGVCGVFFAATAGFSNEPELGCSSLGKYRIGYKYNGRFGIAYKLRGLDSTNSNAYKRYIVLHSYYEVPDNEIYPARVCNSLGCLMVSKNFFNSLSKLIDASDKPVLLWIVN